MQVQIDYKARYNTESRFGFFWRGGKSFIFWRISNQDLLSYLFVPFHVTEENVLMMLIEIAQKYGVTNHVQVAITAVTTAHTGTDGH